MKSSVSKLNTQLLPQYSQHCSRQSSHSQSISISTNYISLGVNSNEASNVQYLDITNHGSSSQVIAMIFPVNWYEKTDWFGPDTIK